MPNRSLTRARKLATAGLGALLSACTDVALQAINTPSYLSGELRAERGIAYGERADQKLDLYLPSGTQARQLIVFVYGGGWTSGSRGAYYFVAEALTAQGYAVAIPDYIKYPDGVFPAFVTDIARSIGWLAHNADRYGEFEQFILMGHSAGAHTAALLLTDPSYLSEEHVDPARIAGFVGLAGPYAFIPKEQRYRDIFDNLEDFSQMRPLHFADGDEPPMLLLHGSDDSTVLPEHSERFADRVNQGGGRAEVRYYEGVGHVAPVLSLSRTPWANDRIRADILDFLEREFPALDRGQPPAGTGSAD